LNHSRTTTLPRRSARCTGWPSTSINVKSGAGLPISAPGGASATRVVDGAGVGDAGAGARGAGDADARGSAVSWRSQADSEASTSATNVADRTRRGFRVMRDFDTDVQTSRDSRPRYLEDPDEPYPEAHAPAAE